MRFLRLDVIYQYATQISCIPFRILVQMYVLKTIRLLLSRAYSCVPNKRAGWKMGQNQINVQGGKMPNLDNLVGYIVNSTILSSNKF